MDLGSVGRDDDERPDAPLRDVIDGLGDALRDADAAVAEAAAGALLQIGRPAVPTLVAAINDDGCLARVAVIEALGRIGPNAAQAVPELKAAAEDDDAAVAKAAAGAIARIELH